MSQLFGYHRVASQYDCEDAYDYIGLTNPSQAGPQVSRRSFLGGSVAGVAGGILGTASMEFFEPDTLQAQTNLTPDEALKHLMEGNERFASDKMASLGTKPEYSAATHG